MVEKDTAAIETNPKEKIKNKKHHNSEDLTDCKQNKTTTGKKKAKQEELLCNWKN